MNTPKRVISHRLSQDLIDRLDKLAIKLERSRTYLIEKAISEYLDKQENPLTEFEQLRKQILDD